MTDEIVVGSVVPRPWGLYKILLKEKGFSVKLLYISPGEETSLQRHSKRNELVTLLDAAVTITHLDRVFTKDSSNMAVSYRIMAGEWHKFAAPADQDRPTILLEVAYGELDPEDFERQHDKYNRVRKVGTGFKTQD